MDELNTDNTAPLPRPPDTRPPKRRFGTGARLVAGLAVLAVLAGGSVLGITLTRGSSPAVGANLTANTAGSSAGKAAASANGQSAVRATKSSGSHSNVAWLGPGARRIRARIRACFASARRLRASGQRAAAWVRLRACIRRYARLRLGLAGFRLHRLRVLIRRTLHGQITIETKSGPLTLTFERGAVQSVSANSLVVRAADGTTLTWIVSGSTRVIKAGRRVGTSALAAGQLVAVIGPVSSGSDQARRIFVTGQG